jgi:predicted site-specific integrase-resolvase
MRISEFSKALGVSRDTVRRLERRGLIRPTRDWAGHGDSRKRTSTRPEVFCSAIDAWAQA